MGFVNHNALCSLHNNSDGEGESNHSSLLLSEHAHRALAPSSQGLDRVELPSDGQPLSSHALSPL